MKTFDKYDSPEDLEEVRKTAPAWAKQMDEDFIVETMEGTMRGSAGDYLMKGTKGELYPCEKEVFEETYEFTDRTTEKEQGVLRDLKEGDVDTLERVPDGDAEAGFHVRLSDES